MSEHLPPGMPADFKYPYKRASFLSDFGFKNTFGEDSLFTRKAVSVLLGEPEPIKKLELVRNEVNPAVRESRGGMYDIVYRDENRRVIIMEMQGKPYSFIEERLQYYTFSEFASLVRPGERGLAFGNLPPVICICIIQSRIFSNRNWHNHFKLMNSEGEQFGSPIEFHTFELGKFPIHQNQADLVKTDIQKLIFTMKYAEKLVEKSKEPPFFEEIWLAEPLRKLDLSNLTPQQMVSMNIDYYNNLFRDNRERWAAELEIEEAAAKARTEGMEKGMEKNAIQTVLTCHEKGFSLEMTAEIAHLPPERVLEILKKHGRIA